MFCNIYIAEGFPYILCIQCLQNVLRDSYSIISYLISYHLFFHGSFQVYKVHMDMDIVNTVHDTNKNMCLISQAVESVLKCTAVLVTGPSVM